MKWCRFHAADGDSIRFGIVEGDQIVEVRGSPFAEYEKTAQKHLLSSTRLAVPAMPYNFYAMGANFRKHLDWANQRFNLKIGVPKAADMGYRSPSALIASAKSIPDVMGDQAPFLRRLAVLGDSCRPARCAAGRA